MAQSPFEIPSPVLEKLDELNEIVKDHPVYIPPQVAAKFLGMNPATLIASIQARQCPFAFGYQKTLHSNATNKIPSATFYLWYTQGWMLKMYDAEKALHKRKDIGKMTAKRKVKPKPCAGCAHYRSSTGSRGGEEICHYILDTGEPRGCPPERCNKRETQAPQNRGLKRHSTTRHMRFAARCNAAQKNARSSRAERSINHEDLTQALDATAPAGSLCPIYWPNQLAV